MALALTYAAASHVGLIRGNNEDSAYAGPYLLALADGMGGHAAGEIASQLMIAQVAAVDVDGPAEDMEDQLIQAMIKGNEAIAEEIEINPVTEGMGCTLDAFFFNAEQLVICHVGDSRGYLLRDGSLEQLTKDDTFVQSLVDEGRLAPEDVSSHPQRSLILKALTGRPVEPTIIKREAKLGDRYLLCSDGLSDPVSLDTMRDILTSNSLQDAAERLIDLALRSGGPDNVTVVVGEIVDDEDPAFIAPEGPLLVGAIDPEETDVARPDTAAGRAFGMRLIQENAHKQHPTQRENNRSVEKDRNSNTPHSSHAEATGTGDAADMAADSEEEGESPAKKRSSGRVALTWGLVVLLIAALIGGGIWRGKNILDNRFYVAATDNDELAIYQGSEDKILGLNFSKGYQRTCLDEHDNLTLAGWDDKSNCHRFKLTDLPPSVRSTVNTLPAGDYNEIQRQLERLAEQALPVCVTRQPQDQGNGEDAASTASSTPSTASAANSPSAANSAPESNSAAPSAAPGNPGDLTTPGVSCREVK